MVIAGLDRASIVNNIVNVKYGAQLDLMTDPDARAVEAAKLQTYLYDTCADFFNTAIQEIQAIADSIYDVCVSARKAAENIVASNAIPAVISTPPSSPNVAYTLIDNRQKKASIISLLKEGLAQMAQLEAVAQTISFTLPANVTALTTALNAILDIANAIPD